MRSKLELWKIVDENFDRFFDLGLCRVISKCYFLGKITLPERINLENELSEYGNIITRYFLGEKRDPKPRKEFIKKMIEKHSK